MIYVSHLLEDNEMKEIVQRTGVGIESIDFSIPYNLDHLGETLKAYERKMEFIGARNLTLHGPFLDLNPAAFDSEIARVTRQRYEQAYAAAKALGAKKIIYHSCHVPAVYMQEGWAPRVVAFYREFLEDKTEEIEILMENVLDPVPELLWECAKEIRHPAFGLCLDVGHAHCFSRVPLSQWLEECGPYIKHFHVHDKLGDRDSHLAAGDGTIPWEEVGHWLGRVRDWTIECNRQEDVWKTWEVVRNT